MDPNMDFDDDGPPMLVAAGQSDDTENLSADVDDMNLTRVPITIITGMQLQSHRITFRLWMKLTLFRLSWCWKNYFDELYPERTPWKENRRHLEWYDLANQSFLRD
jgi:hypothetical protein